MDTQSRPLSDRVRGAARTGKGRFWVFFGIPQRGYHPDRAKTAGDAAHTQGRGEGTPARGVGSCDRNTLDTQSLPLFDMLPLARLRGAGGAVGGGAALARRTIMSARH